MSNVFDLGRSEQVLDEASAWVARLDRGLDDAERAELGRFLEDAAARSRFLELAEHWDKLDALDGLADIMPPMTGRPPRTVRRFALAASIVAVFAAGLFHAFADRPAHPGPGERIAAKVYETAVGETSNLQLTDGTRILLNTDSRLDVHFSESGRLVNLARGEAHFAVAGDRRRPFSVRAGDTLIQAIGTEFSVQLAAIRQVELIVIEGAVRMETRQERLAHTKPGEPPALLTSGRTVGAGSMALYEGNAEATVEPVDDDTIDAKLSWRTGRLTFRGETLQTAIEEIERYTNVEFLFVDEPTRQVAVAGLFKAGDVDGLLDTLQANFHIASQRIDDNRILLSGQRQP